MCSIAMPAELILGHSPPVYSPLLYSPLVVTGPSITSRSVPPRIRPCLSSGSLTIDSIRNSNDRSGKQKKRVVFADDRGRPLTQVRVMSEPSNVPPLWSTAYLAGVTGGLLRTKINEDDSAEVSSPWQVTFPQPASDYLAFRRKLDQENVSLENVIVKESDQCLVGTIKVRNLAYDKEVVVRASSDNWKTHEDVYCTYVEQPGAPALILYDTFRFRLTLPLNSSVVEFCVRYRTDGKEYWDNNEGKNFIVRKKAEIARARASHATGFAEESSDNCRSIPSFSVSSNRSEDRRAFSSRSSFSSSSSSPFPDTLVPAVKDVRKDNLSLKRVSLVSSFHLFTPFSSSLLLHPDLSFISLLLPRFSLIIVRTYADYFLQGFSTDWSRDENYVIVEHRENKAPEKEENEARQQFRVKSVTRISLLGLEEVRTFPSRSVYVLSYKRNVSVAYS